MFDTLLSLTAIIGAIIEGVTIKEALKEPDEDRPSNLKSDYEKGVEFYSKRKVKVDTKEHPRKESFWEQKTREFIESEAKKKENEPQKKKETPFEKWFFTHDKLLLEVLSGGVHIIPYSEMEGVDVDEIADFLFEHHVVESVDKVKEGLEVTVR